MRGEEKDKVDRTVLKVVEETWTEALLCCEADQSVQAKALAGLNANCLFPEEEKITMEGVKQTDCVVPSEQFNKVNLY